MLVTVVSEKSLPRAANVPPTPSRSNTFQNVGSSANQRLKGLLSGRSSTFDKALPTPTQTSSPPTPPPPPVPRASSPELVEMNKVNGGGVVRGDKNRNGALTPTPPPQDTNPTPGLSQVDPPLPTLDLDTTRAPVYESGPRQTGLQTRLLEVMSPPLLPEVAPAIASSPTPYLDSDRTEGRVLDVPASGVQPSSQSVVLQEDET